MQNHLREGENINLQRRDSHSNAQSCCSDGDDAREKGAQIM